MMDTFVTALLWFGAVGCGIMAGVYFTFSAFVMKSLASIDAPAGIAAMQSINDVILRSAFLPLFFGTSLAAAVAVLLYVVSTDSAGGIWMALAGGIYFAGMFLCTVFFNVPLNNKLKAVDPTSSQGEELWKMYLQVWTRWNHVRTVTSTIACAFFIQAV
ncbi:MAG: anthrone oxygenase family protein [Rubricoccaceae bacterium]|nr:anthrone oxygenase family protein [Rubricoccaceae bacterium]